MFLSKMIDFDRRQPPYLQYEAVNTDSRHVEVQRVSDCGVLSQKWTTTSHHFPPRRREQCRQGNRREELENGEERRLQNRVFWTAVAVCLSSSQDQACWHSNMDGDRGPWGAPGSQTLPGEGKSCDPCFLYSSE